MEVTLTVALVLILSIGGFMAYQGFTDNAKRSAVESAANEVFNAAVATLMLPAQETSATEDDSTHEDSGGVQFASHRVATVAANPAIAKIQEDYNAQSENIQVLIEQAGMDVTVTATGWDGEYTAVRSTIPENDGVITGPGYNEEEQDEVEAASQCENPENGCMVLTWDVSKSDNTVRLPISSIKIQDGLQIDWGDGNVTENRNLEHTYEASDDSVYTITIEGKFDIFGNSRTKSGLLSVDEWKNTGTTDLSRAFYYAPDLKHVHEIPSGVKNMEAMFRGASSFNQDVNSWDVSNVTNMSYMFYNATAFNNGDAPGESNNPLDWEDTSQVKYMNNMFYKASSFNQDVRSWDVSNVTNMGSMFYYASSFNQDVSSWDVSNVGNMASMFNRATSFNNGDAPGESNNPLDWEDTSQVKDMRYMFNRAEAFNQDVSSWDFSNVTNMHQMFALATAFNNGDAPGESNNPLDWEVTSQVDSMGYMFYYASSFNQDVSSWDFSNVTNMESMFYYASSFNQDVSSWDVSNVGNMASMFSGATAFNNGDAPGESNNPLDWDVSSVTDMRYMFRSASSFNQDISNWDVSNVETYNNFYTDSGLAPEHRPSFT